MTLVKATRNHGMNNAVNLVGLDPRTRSALLPLGQPAVGICSGIVGSWIIAVLNAVPEATDHDLFVAYFNNVLRFQGAYLKESHGRPEDFFKRLNGLHLDTGCRLLMKLSSPYLSAKQLPREARWACYVAFGGHATGLACTNGGLFAMDPSYGLYEYDTEAALMGALANGQRQQRIHQQLSGKEAADFEFFVPGRGV